MESITVRTADLDCETDQQAIVAMVDAYARDPMGDGAPLPEDVKQRLIPGLRDHPTTLVFLAFAGTEPVGIAVCFVGFSTFQAKPLLNLHDLAVLPEYRGAGVGRLLLEAIEEAARDQGFCAVTLEVFEDNRRARKTYQAAGFELERPGVANARVFFMKKRLS